MTKLKINNLPEIISREEWHRLFKDLKEEMSDSELINSFEVLGDKYEKFWDFKEINIIEYIFLKRMLIRITDFDNLDTMEVLTLILFQFRVDEYYHFLNEKIKEIKSIDVLNEVRESLIEYKTSGSVS